MRPLLRNRFSYDGNYTHLQYTRIRRYINRDFKMYTEIEIHIDEALIFLLWSLSNYIIVLKNQYLKKCLHERVKIMRMPFIILVRILLFRNNRKNYSTYNAYFGFIIKLESWTSQKVCSI